MDSREASRQLIDLRQPIGGLPEVISTPESLSNAIADLAAGVGPIAVDAERASGFRYSQRAYLIQLFREGSGTFLIDPITVGSMSVLQTIMVEQEWVFHAASQDLPSLSEVGLKPTRIFDTELCARLLGLNRVGLGAVVEDLLGIKLAKEHSASDWSTRPLPAEWLSYAALDVQLLLDLREAMHDLLEQQHKQEIAAQEFEAVLNAHPKAQQAEPWRKLSGISKIADRKTLAVARSLWRARDQLAQKKDVSSGRLIPDSAIVSAALANPRSRSDLASLSAFTGRASRSNLEYWWEAILAGRSSQNLPTLKNPQPRPLPPRAWRDRNPLAFLRLNIARAELQRQATRLNLPVENLISPAIVRELSWHHARPFDSVSVRRFLDQYGARPWQIDQISSIISVSFVEAQLIYERSNS